MFFSRATTVFCLILILFFVCEKVVSLDPIGENVCSKTTSFKQNYRQSFQSSYKKSLKNSCGFLGWGQCTRYRIVYTTKYRSATRLAYKKQYFCCKGWKESGKNCSNALISAQICTQLCMNGTCTKPDHCTCNSGYYGNFCDRDCPSHKWGAHCVHNCLCKNNAKCSPHDGTCTCAPGWEGRYCDKPCDQGYYGDKCQQNCICQNRATCEPISGNCTCAPGYQGTRCDRLCKEGTYGPECKESCACQNNATCSPFNGFCNCTLGFTGMHCEKQCSGGAGGEGCKSHCNCTQWGTCNPFTGKCVCQPGYTEENCGSECPDGKYGPKCIGVCNCKNNATCNKADGSCDCQPGWTGVKCGNPCSAGYYGNDCQSKCVCKNKASCDPVTGKCTCVGKWQGQQCDDGLKATKKKKVAKGNDPLLPSVTSCAVVLILVSVAVVFVHRRKKARMRSGQNDEPVYATPHDQPIHEDRNREDGTLATPVELTPVYKSPPHYMGLGSGTGSGASNTYQVLDRKCQKQDAQKFGYDVPVGEETAYQALVWGNDHPESQHRSDLVSHEHAPNKPD